MYTISYMTKEERKTITVSCEWFSIYVLNGIVQLVFENKNSLNGETSIHDIISWSLDSYPIL